MKCNRNRLLYTANFIVIDDYVRDETWKSSPYITVRWTAVVVAVFLLYHRLLWLCFRGGYLPVCVV